MFKLYRVRKALAMLEIQFGGSTVELEANKEYRRALIESSIGEVRVNDSINRFKGSRDLLKVEAINRNLMIKKLIDKVEEDLGAVSFILGSIKETEIKTDFLLKEQEEDIQKMKELHRNFLILEVMLTRFDLSSPGQKFLACNVLLLKSLAHSYESLRPSEKGEETFNDILRRNKKRNDRRMGDQSSQSSNRGGDNLIQNRLEQL
jgi:hypothetical protein